MKNLLFCNTHARECGVYQYGVNFCAALSTSTQLKVFYDEPTSLQDIQNYVWKFGIKAIIYNWHPDIGGCMAFAPYRELPNVKQVLIYHDWDRDTKRYDAVLFSDPTMKDHDNWHTVPRPLPLFDPPTVTKARAVPWIGVHGFSGASGHYVLDAIMKEYDEAVLRMHLAHAHFGDQAGEGARSIVDKCRAMVKEAGKPGITIEVTHDFKPMPALLAWLAQNDLNCYLRDASAEWRGVSSALDAAIAVRRPLAINKCKGFRHLYHLSICVEDRSLKQIMAAGAEPTREFYEANRADKLVARVEGLLAKVGA